MAVAVTGRDDEMSKEMADGKWEMGNMGNRGIGENRIIIGRLPFVLEFVSQQYWWAVRLLVVMHDGNVMG